MAGIDWSELAGYTIRARQDLSVSVTHWTRHSGNIRAFQVLRKILIEGNLAPSTTETGFIKANKTATCFTETPISVMVRLFDLAKHDADAARYLKWEPYGLSFLKPVVYHIYKGRPVLYLSKEEYQEFVVKPGLTDALAWRIVDLDQNNLTEAVDWTHEREWRIPGPVAFGKLPLVAKPIAIVYSGEEREELIAEFPPGDKCPFGGIVAISDLRFLG